MRARPAAVVTLFCLLLATLPGSATEEGTLTDGRTGLVWVADPQFAVTSGYAPGVVMRRAKAVRMVTAMNAGRLPNFGRRDWRLPSERELTRWLRRHGQTPPANASGLVRAWPVVGAATLPGLAEIAVLATNSVQLGHHAMVAGDVVINDAAAGLTLEPTAELQLDHHSLVAGDVQADSLRLDKHSQVTGGATYNQLASSGTIGGSRTSPLALPVYPLLPVFRTASLPASAADVFVAAGDTTVLDPGDYGQIDVAPGGRVVLTGGVYDVRGLHLQGASGCPAPCAVLEVGGATDLRIAQRLAAGAESFLGPASGSGITAADVIVYVAGINGSTGALTATPAAAAIGAGARVHVNLYVPNGSLLFDQHATARGAFLARDVDLAHHAAVTLESFFVNRPPIAQPGSALTQGAAPITIVLRGSDPDGDDLTFSIASGPAQGALGPVVELPPPAEPGEPGRPQGDPPRTAATVTYTPATGGDVEDSFTFRVTDPSGASGTAVVRVNPPASEEPAAPAPTTVVAEDTADDTVVDRPVTLTLGAGAPAGVELTFSILPATGPASGGLGVLAPGAETPRRSASVVYTPASGFVGVDSFQFQACGVVASATVCDSATASVEVTPAASEPSELAPDQAVATPQNTPVSIGLGALASSSGAGVASASRLRFVGGKAALLDPAEVAGNVGDDDGDGLGDNHNQNLAAGAPVLVAAGVNLSGGPGSNGTVRIQIEWELSTLGALGPGSTAHVTLTTNRGSVDLLPTSFFAGSGGNGTLEDSDFESTVEALGAVMPVVGAQGADGTFTFDVRDALNAAIATGASVFVVQGRVDESLASGRGLQIYSTANNPANDGKRPALLITTPPPTPPVTFTILSLPLGGVLVDSLQNAITTVPFTLPGSRVSYLPNLGFLGDDGFTYRAELGTVVDTGSISIVVRLLGCATTAEGCDDGR